MLIHRPNVATEGYERRSVGRSVCAVLLNCSALCLSTGDERRALAEQQPMRRDTQIIRHGCLATGRETRLSCELSSPSNVCFVWRWRRLCYRRRHFVGQQLQRRTAFYCTFLISFNQRQSLSDTIKSLRPKGRFGHLLWTQKVLLAFNYLLVNDR